MRRRPASRTWSHQVARAQIQRLARRWLWPERNLPGPQTRLKSLFRGLVLAAAVAYPLGLAVLALALPYLGQSWWVIGVAVYLPRLPYVLPLPFLALGLRLAGLGKLWWTQLAAFLIWLFPLMGFTFSFRGAPDGPTLRVLSYNVNSGYGNYTNVAREILSHSPDVVLLQELSWDPAPLVAELKPHFATVDVHYQFLIASRFPISETREPYRVVFLDGDHSGRTASYVVQTPLGAVVLYNAHPVSPRSGFNALRGGGLRQELLSGRFFSGETAGTFVAVRKLLSLQIQALAEHAGRELLPVVIVGDLNLPGGSPDWRALSKFQDGFAEAGRGFGYTYPDTGKLRPWMRLDRILASEHLEFEDFEVGSSNASDHHCVVAVLSRPR